MIKCEICGTEVNFIETHLKEVHPEMTISQYSEAFPDAQIMSDEARERLGSITCDSGIGMVEVSIEKAFGVKAFAANDSIMGFSSPHSTTPAIDDDYHFPRSLLAVVLYSMVNRNNPVLLSGPTGSGKSSVVTQVAARLNYPFYRLNCDADIARADFVGQWVLNGKEMMFQYGILPRAMREGAVLVIDEWDSANPAVSFVLQAVLEDHGKLTIAETGEIVEPHENFRIFCTANTIGMGDETGLYNGTQPQNFAALDRFKLVQIVDYPDAKIEQKIIAKKTGIEDEDVLDKLSKFAKLVRVAFVKEEIRVTMSTRTIINVAEKLRDFGDVRVAYTVSYLNKCAGEDRKFAEEALQRVWAV